MRFKVFLVLVFSSLLSSPAIAEITSQHAKSIVRVVGRSGRYNDLGTGTYIGNNLVITAAHVVSQSQSVQVNFGGFQGKFQFNAEVVAIQNNTYDDLALLYITEPLPESENLIPIPFSLEPPEVGTEIVAAGFGGSSRLNWYRGRVLSTGFNGGSQVQTSFNVISGDSGGPIMTNDPILVGVISTTGVYSVETFGSHSGRFRSFFQRILPPYRDRFRIFNHQNGDCFTFSQPQRLPPPQITYTPPSNPSNPPLVPIPDPDPQVPIPDPTPPVDLSGIENSIELLVEQNVQISSGMEAILSQLTQQQEQINNLNQRIDELERNTPVFYDIVPRQNEE